MKKSVARWIRRLMPESVRRGFVRAGIFFDESPPFPSIEGALLCLKRKGFEPRFAIDVGAYVGEWTVLFKRVFPECAVLMVEALEEKFGRLQAVCSRFGGSVECRTALLGASGGRSLRFVEMETGSSVFEERSIYERKVVEKTTCTLDQLLGADPRPVDFIKLDVQGYELEVLRGAERSLGQAQSVLMEASLVPTNQGAPLIAEAIRFMDDRGFRLVDFCSQTRRKDMVLWQTDLLFVRIDSGLLPDPGLTEENWGS